MPNRIIKESICTSEDVNALTPFEETVFYRLIVQCDDFGRFDARPLLLKSRLFPLREDVTAQDVESAVQRLCEQGMVSVYEVFGRQYLCLNSWEAHQNVRARRSKFPPPPWEEE